MRTLARSLVAGVVIACSAGCATPSQKYNWGDYDASLYAYYKVPAKEAELAAALDAIIHNADTSHTTVPPGVYAEYGYLLLQQGKGEDAAKYFALESQHWPESKVFMDRMIQVSAQLKPAAASGEVK